MTARSLRLLVEHFPALSTSVVRDDRDCVSDPSEPARPLVLAHSMPVAGS